MNLIEESENYLSLTTQNENYLHNFQVIHKIKIIKE